MPTLVRDRVTWLAYVQLGIYGYFLYGINPSIPLLREEQGVSRTVGGLHATALATGALVAGLCYPRVVRRLGRGRTLWGGLVVVCAGVLVYCGTTVLPLTLAGAFVASLGGSCVVTGTAASLSEHHGPAGPAAVSEANATAAGLGLLAPLALGLSVNAGIGWRPALLVVLALVAVLVLVKAAVHLPSGPSTLTGGELSPSHVHARLPARYWWGWAVLVMCISVEFCLAIWASDVIVHHTGASPGVAATGVTAMVSGMFAGRAFGARLSLRLSPDVVMYGALVTAGAGFAVFWSSPLTWLAMTGLVVFGLGIALLFPVGIVRAIALAEGRTDLAAGRTSMAAAVAVGVGPFAFGALADVVGPHTASLVVPVMLGAAALFVRLSRMPADAAEHARAAEGHQGGAVSGADFGAGV